MEIHDKHVFTISWEYLCQLCPLFSHVKLVLVLALEQGWTFLKGEIIWQIFHVAGMRSKVVSLHLPSVQ